MKPIFQCFRYLAVLLLIGATQPGCSQSKDKDMNKIQFDIGKNISATAKESNAPRFSVRNIQGLVSYSIDDFPPSIIVQYRRPGYEVDFPSLFAMTMYADEANQDNLAVSTVDLQVTRRALKSHDAGREFITNLISQFKNGKWVRFIDEHCPALTGRSTYLDERGELTESTECGLDPYYEIPQAEWILLFKQPQYYHWTGDGVFVTLTAYYSNDTRGITYNVDLEFEDFGKMRQKQKQALDERLVEGDKAGYDSTADHIIKMKKRAEQKKVLEAAAIKRGDPLFISK